MKYDHLSSLLESLAHHILSFLDMKDVVRIRILWWRYISTSIPYLNFKFHAPLASIISKTLSLREAYINVWRPQGGISGVIECLYSLETSLQNLCHVIVLKLSTDCIQFLKALTLRALQNLPPLIFKHKHLILETGPTKWELPGIVYLLKNSPDLETLSVKIEESILCYDLSMVLGEEFEFDETEYWESFISPFSYVVHYLKTIKIWDAASELYLALRITSEASSRNSENGVRFLKIFLKSAIRLEKLTYITKPNFKGIHDIAQMISALPIATSSAEILVCL
ncbi:hypothetical protein MRB53_000406 [Persea americana]|uniref:Uncharacterized protein n=1 Tax=Persea americana TaxID=3435 RepID=A0ACC2MPR0_PERAE|nr:hypothetical protein MRB53_000406 [Persea americana]